MHSSHKEWSESDTILHKSKGDFKQLVRRRFRALPGEHSLHFKEKEEENWEEEPLLGPSP